MSVENVNYARLAKWLGEPYYEMSGAMYSKQQVKVSDADLVLAVLEKLAREGGCRLGFDPHERRWVAFCGVVSRSAPTHILAIDALIAELTHD